MSAASCGGWRMGSGNVRTARAPGVTSLANRRFCAIPNPGRCRNATPRMPVRMTVNFGGGAGGSVDAAGGAGERCAVDAAAGAGERCAVDAAGGAGERCARASGEGRGAGLSPAMSRRSLMSC